ncbi:uncharacterized protein LOC116805430 [Drosophila grimshawi]|uniref:uncharacterized protein LOC116805430 n=1 Tax=Drosophila grimshawi TaxID=7222 RepID=UPI000C86FD26|nr:uncharacterized protein LOC116805430 [Drosophila grimshawi]
MPCFKQEKSLLFRPRRDKTNDRDLKAPKAVRPRAIKCHGLFGMAIARQHLIVDEKWTPASLSDQYGGMTELLRRRVIYKRHETNANRLQLLVESKRLRNQCADGRTKLQKISQGNNTHKIRNFLIRHKDMQRLYQKMPIHQVVDNINQRTFTMRKERDRLELRLDQLKHTYKELLLDRGEVENLIRYENEFVLEEQLKSRELLKRIENSKVRLKAIKTINTTYKKMLQVLIQDEIFYEPILRSLVGDMEDQSNFIKHILYLGIPAISKFRKLNREFLQLDAKSRMNVQEKIEILASLKTPKAIGGLPQPKTNEILSADPNRYVRDTQSMSMLKRELQTIEKTIKELKLVTLCSQAKEIYPRVKSQVENNQQLIRKVEHERQNRDMLENKMNYASMLKDILVNNLSEEEINRLERIKDLKRILKGDEEFEQETVEHIKNRGDAFVLIRIRLWNLIEILRHIDRDPKMFRSQYPNSYLKLPLLKFDLHNVYAAPPELYEEDTEKIMNLLKRKVYKLMKSYKAIKRSDKDNSREKYHIEFLNTINYNPYIDEDEGHGAIVGEDLLQAQKTLANIPDRKQIKAQSSRLVEDHAKLDER